MRSSYYAGIHNFKGYLRRVFGKSAPPYDWADLSSKERDKFAAREAAEPRERRVRDRT